MDFAQAILDKATVVHLQPDDVLVLSGLGPITPDDAQRFAAMLHQNLPGHKVLLLDEGIRIDLERELDPCPYCSRPEGWDACPIHRDGQDG